MTIFKRIDIDMGAERARIARCKFSDRQRAALVKLCDLFEAGEWQACLNHALDKKAFGRDPELECDEKEFIGEGIQGVLASLGYANYYTQEKLLADAKEKLLTSGEIVLKS